MSEAASVFSGGAFEGEDDSVAFLGSIRVSGHAVLFEAEGFSLNLPTQDLHIDLDSSNERATFTHPNFPGWTVYSFDLAILDQPGLQRFGLKEQIEQLKYAHAGPSSHVRRVYLALAAVLGTILFLWLFTSPILGVIVNLMPADWEQKVGAAAFADFSEEFEISKDPALTNRLFLVTERLKKGFPPLAPKFEYYVGDDPLVNAFALPGGKVIVMRGLIEKTSPDELAGVLAHEVAHGLEKHSMRQLAQIVGPALIVTFFFDANGALGSLTAAAASLGALQYSRQNETDADDEAWEILTRANIDPRSLGQFLNKLRKIEGRVALPALSTHPATIERVQRLDGLWQSSTKKSGFKSVEAPILPTASEF